MNALEADASLPKNLGKREPVVFYNGTIVFRDLDRRSSAGVYAEVTMCVRAQKVLTRRSSSFKENAPTVASTAFGAFL